jgi:DNA replication factor GINS
MDYKILRKIQQEEKSSPLLTKIDDYLFNEAMSYHHLLLKRLKTEEKPSRNLIISEQIQNVEKIIRNIYEIREKKIILSAMAKARGGSPSEKHFSPLEVTLFQNVSSLLLKNRNVLLNYQENEKQNTSKVSPKTEDKKFDENVSENNFNKKGLEHSVVRIIETIPTFIGTDSNPYDLKKQDIVTVPQTLASMLIEKHVAVLVRTSP